LGDGTTGNEKRGYDSGKGSRKESRLRGKKRIFLWMIVKYSYRTRGSGMIDVQ